MPWLERRAPTIRDAIVLRMVLALLESETIRADTAAAVVQFSQQAVSPLELTKALLRRDLLSGNFDAAVRRVAALPPDDITVTSAYAVIDFLTGRNAQGRESCRRPDLGLSQLGKRARPVRSDARSPPAGRGAGSPKVRRGTRPRGGTDRELRPAASGGRDTCGSRLERRRV
jgi:hypothetical protein